VNQVTGVKRIINAAGYSWKGCKAAWIGEAAFRQELVMAVILLPLAIWLGDTGIERGLMIGSLFLVLIVELLNSAIEAIVDRVGTEHHELSGKAKDMGSAAVFFALVNVPVTWGFIIF
jgi:diacylglycerol kinase (ATP)